MIEPNGEITSGEAKHIATGHAMKIYNCLNCPRQLKICIA